MNMLRSAIPAARNPLTACIDQTAESGLIYRFSANGSGVKEGWMQPGPLSPTAAWVARDIDGLVIAAATPPPPMFDRRGNRIA